MMKPPLIIRLLPDRLKEQYVCRKYSRLPEAYYPLIPLTRLRFGNKVAMPCLLPTDLMTCQIALTGFFELKLSRVLQGLAKQGGRFVDVGANQGYYSLLWLGNRASNQCISVEASPRNLKFLKANIAANSFESACQIVPHAAGAETSKMRFDLGPEEQTGWGGFFTGSAAGQTVEVDVVRLDELVQDDQPIAALKVDVEGADSWVLQGARRLLERRQIRNIFFEQHGMRTKLLGIEPDAGVKFLREVGYRVELFNGEPGKLAEYHALPR